MEPQLYCYEALVTAVYDADTITVDLNLGLSVVRKGLRLRLYGIDAPEVRGVERPEGLVARDFLRDLILDKKITVETIKDSTGKYGRYLANIWIKLGDGDVNINELLVQEGHAEFREY